MDAQSDTSMDACQRTAAPPRVRVPHVLIAAIRGGGGPRLARVTINRRHYVYLRNLHCLVIQRCTCSTMSEIRNTLGFTCSNCLETWTPCGMHMESGNPAD